MLRRYAMQCLDLERLESVSTEAFQGQQSFPWANPVGLLHPDAFEALANSLPDVGLFDHNTGVVRKFGQPSHDRYNLEYRPGLELSDVWQCFIEELKGDPYRAFLERLFGRSSLRLPSS